MCRSKRPKAIFFDVGGVLLSYSAWKIADQALDNELKRKFPGLNIRQLHKIWSYEWDKRHRLVLSSGFEKIRKQAEIGLYRALIQLNCKSTRAYVKRTLNTWYAVAEKNSEAMPGASDVLKLLSSSGYRIGIITNADWDVVIPHLKRADLLKFIDYEIISSRIRSYKPHLRPFREALRISKLKPQEIVFVGDNVDTDIEPAKRIGMRALLLGRRKRKGASISALKDLLELLL